MSVHRKISCPICPVSGPTLNLYYNQFTSILQHCAVWYIKKGGNAPRGLWIKRASRLFNPPQASILWGTKTINVVARCKFKWTIPWSLATITAIKIGGGGKQMHLRCGPFWWPWRCAGAIRSASPNAAWPGLHRKPLDAAIGRLLAPYCPGGHQGDSKWNVNATCTHFAGHIDGRGNAAVWYHAHRPMEENHGFHKSN